MSDTPQDPRIAVLADVLALVDSEDIDPATLLAALDAVDPARVWRPIAEVPRDGTEVLLCVQWRFGAQRYVGKLRRGFLGEPRQELLAWRCSSSGRFATPTHFLPLPEPPEDV